MVVHDEETLEEAIQMLAVSPPGVRYVDEFAYIIITTPETLESQCRRALTRNDIAIVVPLGQEREMESYPQSLAMVLKEREIQMGKGVREWIREHPKQVEKIKPKSKARDV